MERTHEEALLLRSVQRDLAAHLDGLGWSRAYLAERSGLSVNRIGRILAGRGNLTLSEIAAILFAMGARMEIRVVSRHP